MTREQAKKNLISFGIEEPTEEQISNYLNGLNGEVQSEKAKVKNLKEKADKADELQAKLDELNEKDMSEAEKANKALEDAQKQIAELQKSNVSAEVKAILNGAGLTEEDYKGFLPGLVTDDVEASKAMANALVGSLSKNAENAVKKHEQDTLDGTKTPDGGKGSGDDDKEKTDAVKFAESFVGSNSTDNKSAESIIGNYV